MPKVFLCACSLGWRQDVDSKSLSLVFFPTYRPALLLLSSGICRPGSRSSQGVGGSTTSCKKRWELGSSTKPLLSDHVLSWWWSKFLEPLPTKVWQRLRGLGLLGQQLSSSLSHCTSSKSKLSHSSWVRDRCSPGLC